MVTKVKSSHVSSLVSKRLAPFFKDYAAYHTVKENQIAHVLGISLIVVGLFGMLSSWIFLGETLTGSWPGASYFRLDAGIILYLLGIAWYFYMDWRITIPYSFVMLGLYFLGRTFSFQANLVLFLIGWILQGIGHFSFEKNSPAFAKNLTHLLIGPLWVFAKLIGYR